MAKDGINIGEQIRPTLAEARVAIETTDADEEVSAQPCLDTPRSTFVDDEYPPRDFVTDYVRYADVLEAPAEAHEAVATQLLAAAMSDSVFVKHGSTRVPLDLWLLLLSSSGFGRNTLVGLADPVLKAAGLESIVRPATWGSRAGFYQDIAEHPSGLFVWPELSVILKKFDDRAFSGTKEWLTDRYDNLSLPEAIRYRKTGKKSDTPPITFTQAPRINILATSSLDWFLSNVHQEDALGGFVPRWVVRRLGSGRVVPIPEPTDERLIHPLAQHLKKASELKGEVDLSHVHGFYARWYKKTRSRFSRHPNASLAMPFFNRLRTHVLKLAVIYEVSQSLSLCVTRQALERAFAAASASEGAIFKLLEAGLNREGAELERMTEAVRSTGSTGMPKSEFTRLFQHVQSREREGRLNTLLDGKTLRSFWRATSGRSAVILVHEEHFEAYKRRWPGDKEK